MSKLNGRRRRSEWLFPLEKKMKEKIPGLQLVTVRQLCADHQGEDFCSL